MHASIDVILAWTLVAEQLSDVVEYQVQWKLDLLLLGTINRSTKISSTSVSRLEPPF